MAERRRSSEIRQVELVDAALEVIATKGIAALTTRSLAEQASLSTGAIFRHFATLDDLLDAVVSRVEAVLEATYPPVALPPLERLRRFIEARSTAVASQRGIPRLLLSEQFLLALPRQGSERLAACRTRTRAFIVACLNDAQRAGDVRSDLPVDALAPIVMGTVQMLALARPSPLPRAAEVRDALLALLRAPRTENRPRRPARKRTSP
jgi:AcrR family transcriptional regulator